LQAVMENAANGDAGRGTHASQHASAVLLYRLGGGRGRRCRRFVQAFTAVQQQLGQFGNGGGGIGRWR
jgi:hypothetical protein